NLSEGPLSISGGLIPSQKLVDFHVVFDLNRDLGNLPLNLGTGAESLGLSLDASANVDLAARLNLDVEFGIDLTQFLSNPPGGISDNDVFVQVNNASASGHIHPDDLNFTATLGFLQAGVSHGTADLNATAVVSVDNNGNKRLTLHDLTTLNLVNLIHLTTPTSTLDNPTANNLSI